MANGSPGTSLTVAGLWIDGAALLRPHLGNIIWIAAMFLFLPQLAVDILSPKPTVPTLPGSGTLAAIALVSVVGLVGQLASIAILLGGPASPRTIGEAIQRGFQMTPRALLALLLVFACLLPAVLLLGAAGAALGVNPAQLAKPTLSLSLLLLVFMGFMLVCAARLVPLNAVLIREQHPAWPSVRRAWAISKDASWAIAGFLLTLMLALYATAGLLNMVGGVVVSLLFGGSVVGKLILATLTAAASTGFSLMSLSMGVVAYRSLAK